MKTVHVIFNAHIDPIWLWPWQSGLDEVLATCRGACDRLDAHSDLHFTRGEAWVYDEVERIDPALFARIRGHVEAGRWEIVGGWWLQPDCNQPSGFAMEHQIDLGKSYFKSRFGSFPRIGYNVDSFGHAATLPGLMYAAGQDRYVMMRPQPHEMTLPACLFRWRGYVGGPEVTTFRIVSSYTSGNTIDEARVHACVDQLPPGIDDTMLFAGFGDHGGGPTERQIQWFRDHQDSFEGINLVFSSPSRFFDAICSKRESLPLVTGDLQQHAIGCYSVYRPIKTALRKAEHLVEQAEIFAEAEPALAGPDSAKQIQTAWKKVCFNHFHDTLGGTCLPSAYAYPLAQLGYARDVAETILQEGLRRKLNSLPDDPNQRIVLYNASDLDYSGPVEFAPWLDWTKWESEWDILDEQDGSVPFQLLAPEALAGNLTHLFFSIDVPAGACRVLRIRHKGNGPAVPAIAVTASLRSLSIEENLTLTQTHITFEHRDHPDDGASDPGADGQETAEAEGVVFNESTADWGIKIETPTLVLYDDPSDTWSHGIDRFSDAPISRLTWQDAEVVDQGPLMGSWIRNGTIGESRLSAEWRVYNEGFAELRLTVDWREQHKLLKLVQPLPTGATTRIDGILGGWLTRPFDGRELPIRDGVLIQGSDTGDDNWSLGIVSPDVYAVDATESRLRFTLLRSAIMAHHVPHKGLAPRRVFTDQGEHMFVFRFLAGHPVPTTLLDKHAGQLNRPLIAADLTRGMPCRVNDR